ncbi:MAG TPA: flagellar basal body P-ring protein FlgI [Bacteroidota bacterium]|nr:flagellar basal body P-ring protein FlgI [Bacteroidota bacterium]
MNQRKLILLVVAILLLMVSGVQAQAASRIKDIAYVMGVRGEQVLGYGLAVGLAGTGDTQRSSFTVQSVTSMLKRFGITVPQPELRLRNVAAVMVTSTIPAFTKPGGTADVTVSSMGDATSLQGGTLLMTPLSGSDGSVYAIAQGSISVGGFDVRSTTGARVGKNHTAAGRIPNGASVETAVATSFGDSTSVALVLNTPDFTTSKHIADAINKALGEQVASSVDANLVNVKVPASQTKSLVGFISILESLEVEVDTPARVVINERTGTVIIGSNVSISAVAISHGGLNIEIESAPVISQPNGFSQGKTVVTKIERPSVTQDSSSVVALNGVATVQDVAKALNSLKVSPRDMIAIFQALKEVGALKAELVII